MSNTAVTTFICGGKSTHEHNDEAIHIETFDGKVYFGTKEEMKQYEAEAQLASTACSICGSTSFHRSMMGDE